VSFIASSPLEIGLFLNIGAVTYFWAFAAGAAALSDMVFLLILSFLQLLP
jgi:hypothetical protein